MNERFQELERLVKLLCDRAQLCQECKNGFYVTEAMACYPSVRLCDNCKSIGPYTAKEQRYIDSHSLAHKATQPAVSDTEEPITLFD